MEGTGGDGVSVMVSEGKTMASDGTEVDYCKGWCRGGKGYTRVQAQRKRGKSKNEGSFWP